MKSLTALTLAFLATNADARVLTIGVGVDSCATAFSQQNRLQAAAWVLGFWSARNLERNATVGETTDAQGIVAEVELACSRRPSTSLNVAALVVYDIMEAEAR